MPARNRERAHRIRLVSGYLLAIALIAGLLVYGFDYYTLDSTERPFSPKHVLLKPSGAIGVKLGFLGFAMFLAIFLYPLRKRWAWLARQGSSKHWLDMHVLLGLSAPFIIALHSSFKFRGFAGMAFWIMLAVSLSGVIGRYLYAQIPRSLNAAELSIKELQEVQATLSQQLKEQKLLPQADLRSLLRLPSQERVQQLSIVVALAYMMVLDVGRAFRIAKIRRHALGLGEKLVTLGGVLRTRHPDLEKAIATAREEAATAKRVLFLSRSQQVFHLWHVVHKPFSYSFAVLALIHIVVVFMMGFF
ncbi:MAG TPA: hypothetical protein VMT28_01840 [Terriglobales bacterium]|jgi:hypothetical protein|nr:hypothetical protein [Terriglobales bacterium]